MSCFDFCEQGLGREDEHVDVAFVGSLRGRERGGGNWDLFKKRWWSIEGRWMKGG